MYNGGNGKILLVDDEPNTLKMMSALLTEWDYQVSVAPNVETAIRTVQSSPLDVVVSDIQMPDQDGMVLFEFLSQRFPEIPVIFLTAFPTVDAAVQAMAQGAYYYLAKPPNFQNLQRLEAGKKLRLGGGQCRKTPGLVQRCDPPPIEPTKNTTTSRARIAA